MSSKTFLLAVIVLMSGVLLSLFLLFPGSKKDLFSPITLSRSGKLINGEISPQEIKEVLEKDYPGFLGTYRANINYFNQPEEYQLYLPRNYKSSGKYPLLLSYSLGPDQWSKYADKYNFVFAYGDISRFAMAALREKIIREYPIDPDNIYLTGFSAGAFQSSSLILARPDKFRGAILASGGDLGGSQMGSYIMDDSGPYYINKRFFITLGEKDYEGNVSGAQALKDFLEKKGTVVKFELRPGAGHEYPSEKNEEMIRFVLSK